MNPLQKIIRQRSASDFYRIGLTTSYKGGSGTVSITEGASVSSSITSEPVVNSNANVQGSLNNVVTKDIKDVSKRREMVAPLIKAIAERYNLPFNLLESIVEQESNYNTHAVSHAGARGLGQLMPGTARGLGVKDSFNAVQNLDGAARYIVQKLKEWDYDLSLALASYNAGSGNVRKYGGIPPFKETQNYVKKILQKIKVRGGIPDLKP